MDDRPQQRRFTKSFGLIGCCLVCAATLLYYSGSIKPPSLRNLNETQLELTPTLKDCSPFSEPGYLSWNPAQNNRTAEYISYETSKCSPSLDYLSIINTAFPGDGQISQSLRDTALESLNFLRSKTILLIGDSVDRNSLEHARDLTNGRYWLSDYEDPLLYDGRKQNGPRPGFDAQGVPHAFSLDALDFRIVNGFFYGLDDRDEFSAQPDWHAPGKCEDRIRELFVPFMERSRRNKPDLIQLQSGLWDLALFGRQDMRDGQRTNLPLSKERLQWWHQRMKSVIESVQSAWPGVPIYLRTMHRVGWTHSASWDYLVSSRLTQKVAQSAKRGIEDDPNRIQNFFTDLRCKQLLHAQKHIANEMHLPLFDFANIWEGYQDQQYQVHPNGLPGGIAYLNPLLHHLRMHSK